MKGGLPRAQEGPCFLGFPSDSDFPQLGSDCIHTFKQMAPLGTGREDIDPSHSSGQCVDVTK